MKRFMKPEGLSLEVLGFALMTVGRAAGAASIFTFLIIQWQANNHLALLRDPAAKDPMQDKESRAAALRATMEFLSAAKVLWYSTIIL